MGCGTVSLCLELPNVSFRDALRMRGCPRLGSVGAPAWGWVLSGSGRSRLQAPSLLLPDPMWRKPQASLLACTDLQLWETVGKYSGERPRGAVKFLALALWVGEAGFVVVGAFRRALVGLQWLCLRLTFLHSSSLSLPFPLPLLPR